MGLDIHGEKTGGHICGSYHRLHHTARKLALLYCGAPETLDFYGKEDFFTFYMSGYCENKFFDPSKVRGLLFALQISGVLFPHLLMHSDCDGDYSRRGKLDINGKLLTGNSVKLMKELETLVNEEKFQDKKYEYEMEYTKAFYELVKNEVESGNGHIIFR